MSQQQESEEELDMSVTQSPLPEEPQKFGIGEIVWAKVRGFPWWPAKVRSRP